jgi:hypothetical protein
VNANAQQPQQQSPQTACGVPYYPVRAGLERQYRTAQTAPGVAPEVYTESFADIGPESFTLRSAYPQLTVNTGWRCTREGMLALEQSNLRFADARSGVRAETTARSGVTIPAAERWRVGESWETGYEISVSLPPSATGPGGTGAGTFGAKSRITGEETVTVPAGTFRALKVESVIDMRLTLRVGQATVPSNTKAKDTTWFAEGVGKIKSVTSSDFAVATTELLAVKQ